jgi:hypothetical protein
MIHASVSDLRQAFHRHHSAVQATKDNCSHLLLFYAVECGLKSIWLKRNKLPSTDRIRNQTLLSKDGHNFGVWIKELGLQRKVFGDISTPKPPNFRLHKDSSSWEMSEAHQAWRYGIRVNSEDQKILVEWLEKVCIWIKEEIN